MAETSIEWTDRTWNPIRGCTRVSEGCRHCYAERVAARFTGPGLPYEGLAKRVGGEARWTGEVRFVEVALLEPLRRRKPTTWFVNSMSDLFHEKVPDAWVDRIFAVMALCPQHTFQVLTKRPARMRRYVEARAKLDEVGQPAEDIRIVMTALASTPSRREMAPALKAIPLGRFCASGPWPLPNVWLGTSCEDQAAADARVPDLLATPAAVRFVSAEPLLGPIDFRFRQDHCDLCGGTGMLARWPKGQCHVCGGRGSVTICGSPRRDGYRNLDWIIVGGESGPRARPMHPAWARDIRDQCAAAGVSFHFKQWGEMRPYANDRADCAWFDPNGSFYQGPTSWPPKPEEPRVAMVRVGKKAAGRLLDGVEHNGMPPSAAVCPALAAGGAR